MVIKHNFDQVRSIRHCSLSGEISYHEIMNALKACCKNSDRKPSMNVLWDLTNANIVNITAEQVRHIANFMGDKCENCLKNKAALVTIGEFEFGMARMYEIYLENNVSGEVEVFRGVEKALAWLGTDQEHLEVDSL